MFGKINSQSSFRKYAAYFGNLFSEVYIERFNSEGEQEQLMKVPINYGPRDKFLARVEGNEDLDRPIAAQLPRMSFEMLDPIMDPERRLNPINRIPLQLEGHRNPYMFMPTPWNFDFTLSILTKSLEDRHAILENILPNFNPEYTGTIIVNGKNYDIPLILNGVNNSDTYEGTFEDRRTLISTLTFTLKGWIFGPIYCGGSIITQAEVNFLIPEFGIGFCQANPDNTKVSTQIIVTPGLTANGEPTSDPTKTIDRSLINRDDDYGYIVEINEDL